MIQVSNREFLTTLFKDQAARSHITSFFEPPEAIPDYARGRCWAGGSADEYAVDPGSNQYFCISIFERDRDMPLRSLRRKSLFESCHVIVADDVVQKVPAEQALKLPPPTYKLETSPGSEQWGWVLSQPETERSVVENLLDGLVDRGLAPDGKDPGMKGVTRYVRLPEGTNRKIKHLQPNGQGYPCRMLEWHPTRTVDIEDLAAPFDIDLGATRGDSEAELVEDSISLDDFHPALQHLQILGKLSAGKFSVVCPWVDGHTDGDDSGSAIFLKRDGGVGFKCHHGSCQERTWADVLQEIPIDWQIKGMTGAVPTAEARVEPGTGVWISQDADMDHATAVERVGRLSPDDVTGIQAIINAAAGFSEVERAVIRSQMMDGGILTASAFDKAVKARWRDQKRQRVDATTVQDNPIPGGPAMVAGGGLPLGQRYVFIAEQNAFWDVKARIFISREGYNGLNGASRDDGVGQTPSQLLLEHCPKAAKLTYHPGIAPGVVRVNEVKVLNTWTPSKTMPLSGVGDPEPWLAHAKLLIPSDEERNILFDWMAWTLQNQGMKSNWQILLAGFQGSGKDTLLLPLKEGIGRDNTIEIPAERLKEPYEDYLKNKLLIVQEIENFEKRNIQNRLKRILASSGGTGMKIEPLTVRMFGQKPQTIPNLVQTVFMSNHRSSAMQISEDDRRVFAIWSEFNPGNDPLWLNYFKDMHNWLNWHGPTGGEYPDGYGVGVVLDWLLRRDVSDFGAQGRAPDTQFKTHLIEHSRSNLDTIIREALADQEGPFRCDLVSTRVTVRWLKREHDIDTSEKHLGTIFTRIQAVKYKDGLKGSGGVRMFRYWAVRNVDKWQSESGSERARHFEKNGVKDYLFGGPKLVK